MKYVIIFLLVAGMVSAGSVEGDRQALEELYASTSGASWTNNGGWLSSAPLGDWYGVDTDEAGRVVRLDLFNNNLVGELPESFGALDTVEFFNIKHNSLTGPIPESIGNLSRVKYLLLAGSTTSDERGVPSELRDHYPAKADWGGNTFTGNIPASIGRLPVVEYLDISRNDFEGTTIPDEIGNLTTLRGLYMNMNGWHGQLPESFGNLVNLQHLQLIGGPHTLHNNHHSGTATPSVSGEIPSSWGSMTQMRYLRLFYNGLSGQLPDGWKNMSDLVYFNIGNNQFNSYFPTMFTEGPDKPSLRGIQIRGNVWTGSIPDGIGELNLGTFYVSPPSGVSGQLSGDIPHSLFRMGNLIAIDVIGAGLSGTIPDNLSQLNWARNLYLLRNNFSGTLPSVLPESKNLINLNFADNNFSGQIPQAFVEIDNTGTSTNGPRTIFLNKNNLEGPIPDFSLLDDGSGKWSRLSLHENRFVFADFLEHHAAINDLFGDGLQIAPQKPFGQAQVYECGVGEDLIIDYSHKAHVEDVAVWTKDGDVVSGESSHVLSLSELSQADAGVYRLQLSNPLLPELGVLESRPVDIRVSVDSSCSQTDDSEQEVFDKSVYSSPRSGFVVDDVVRVVDTAVFETGYYSSDGFSWEPFVFAGSRQGSWVLGEAVNEQVPVDARYYAVFSCSWVSGWDCSDTWQVLER